MTLSWMLHFLRLVFRDAGLQLRNVLRYLSGFKLLKILVMAFFTAQFFYFANKFFVYLDFSFYWQEIGALTFLFLIFPIIFTIEKFVSATVIARGYDAHVDTGVWSDLGQKLKFYLSPKRVWGVYLLSQASSMIDLAVFSFIFSVTIFLTNFDYKNSIAVFLTVAVLLLLIAAIFVSLFLWNHTFQVFRFWDKSEKGILEALQDSYSFVNKRPRKFLTLHTIVKFLQFIIPVFIGLLSYVFSGWMLTFLNRFFAENRSIYILMFVLAFLSFSLYQLLVAFTNVYSFRLAHYFEVGNLDEDYKPHFLQNDKQLKTLRILNALIILISLVFFFYFIRSQTIAAYQDTQKVSTSYPNIVKLYNNPTTSTTTIEEYLTPSYSNGIAVKLFEQDGELYVQPLVSEITNPLVPSTVSIADMAFFNLSQTFVKPEVKIAYKDALEFSNARKFALFLYISDTTTLDALASSSAKAMPGFTVFFTNSLQLASSTKEKLPEYRVGSIVKVVDADNYLFQQIFIFNKDLKQADVENLRNKGIKIYVILQEGETPDPTLDLSQIQGIFTDLPKISYNEVRTVSQGDVLQKVILSPLKFFGF
jgi:hypothetical protein